MLIPPRNASLWCSQSLWKCFTFCVRDFCPWNCLKPVCPIVRRFYHKFSWSVACAVQRVFAIRESSLLLCMDVTPIKLHSFNGSWSHNACCKLLFIWLNDRDWYEKSKTQFRMMSMSFTCTHKLTVQWVAIRNFMCEFTSSFIFLVFHNLLHNVICLHIFCRHLWVALVVVSVNEYLQLGLALLLVT